MSKLRITLRVFGVVVIGVGLLYLWAVQGFNRDFDKFISASTADISDLGTAIRGAAGEAFFTRGAFPPKRSDLGKPPDLFPRPRDYWRAIEKILKNSRKCQSIRYLIERNRS
jgi:hypothetical protein